MSFKHYIFLFIFSWSLCVVSQEHPLDAFKNLVDKTWEAEGKWSDGSIFKQEITFNFDLNKTIVISNTKGFTDKAKTNFEKRNHGIRQFNSDTQQIDFWEFDVYGGVTQGTVLVVGKTIFYQYQYGDAIITDCWEYIDENTCKFTVGTYKDGKWMATYLQTNFKLKNE